MNAMCNLFIQNLTARGNGEWGRENSEFGIRNSEEGMGKGEFGMGDKSTRSPYGARKKSAHRVNEGSNEAF